MSFPFGSPLPSWLLFPQFRWFQGAGSASPEFLEWRHRFLTQRVALLTWVMLGILTLFAVLVFRVAIPSLNATGNPSLVISHERTLWAIQVIASQWLSLVLALVLFKYPWSREHPERLFLVVAGICGLVPQIISTFYGEASLDNEEWILFFSAQAILIPVCWRLHLLSQVSVLGLFGIKALIFGMRDSRYPLEMAYISAATYTLLVCCIANLGVYLYERALRREFDLRQQVQVFLHAVSHDLRNPILGTLMTLRAIRTPGQELSLPDELVVQMIDSGDRQMQLINSLLEAHATEMGGIRLQTQAIQLQPLIASVLVDLQPFLSQAKTETTLAIAPNLPLIEADSLQLRRVYENLISNALKYNRPGLKLTLEAQVIESGQTARSIKPSRKLWHRPFQALAASAAGWIHCTVSDNGAGMSQQQCDRLFDLYARGANARQTLGLGLGLYICRQIILAHGGEMGVISHLGEGTRFWFTLPITAKSDVERIEVSSLT